MMATWRKVSRALLPVAIVATIGAALYVDLTAEHQEHVDIVWTTDEDGTRTANVVTGHGPVVGWIEYPDGSVETFGYMDERNEQ